jgi:prepilin-type N-terminal cleavage/methylation domain-containing protein
MDMSRQYARATTRSAARCARLRAAFTLVELLVVVSIIALLISILLPSLKKARDQAKQAKCLANLSAIGKGNSVYGSEWGGWFVGSPVTTGQQLFPKSGGGWPADTVRLPRDVVQVWDWAGPIAAQTTGLHWHRAERWRTTLITGMFECPSNQVIVEPFPNGTPATDGYAGFGPQLMVSYNTMRALMTRPAFGSGSNAVSLQYYHPQVGGTLYGTATDTARALAYVPRIEAITSPSEKIFLADGSRYTTTTTQSPPEGKVDYGYDWQSSAGGAFSNCAPTASDASGGDYLTGYRRSAAYPLSSRYSYRHPSGRTLGLVGVYFDGHAEWMSEKQSRWPDPWWPKGTWLPRSEMNIETQLLTRSQWNTQSTYVVRR